MKQPLIFKPEFHSMVKSCSRVIYLCCPPACNNIGYCYSLDIKSLSSKTSLLNACGGNQVLLSALEGPFTA